MKDMESIKIAREETDLEWRPVLDGVHAYVDLRRLGRRLAAERHVTDETIARLRGALERAERALQGIATAQRFNRDVFSDDSAYVDWARSLSLHAAEIARAALAGEGEGASDA